MSDPHPWLDAGFRIRVDIDRIRIGLSRIKSVSDPSVSKKTGCGSNLIKLTHQICYFIIQGSVKIHKPGFMVNQERYNSKRETETVRFSVNACVLLNPNCMRVKWGGSNKP